MSALWLLLVWCGAGLSGLYWGGVGPGRGPEGFIDYAFAALLGPFAFLISHLAANMELDEDASGGEAHSTPSKPETRAQRASRPR